MPSQRDSPQQDLVSEELRRQKKQGWRGQGQGGKDSLLGSLPARSGRRGKWRTGEPRVLAPGPLGPIGDMTQGPFLTPLGPQVLLSMKCSWPAEISLWPLFSFPEPCGRAHIPGALPLALSLLLSRCPFSLMLSELLCAVSMLLFTSMREKQTLGGDTLFISARRL